ncbi:MAG: DUF6624 domain-containing protein [Tepidisphaeraceae bacterium]
MKIRTICERQFRNLLAARAIGFVSVALLLAGCAASNPPSSAASSHPRIATELIELSQRDGAARASLNADDELIDPTAPQRVSDVDASNTRQLKAIVDKIGWPTPELVGPQAASAALLLLRHAGSDPAFQARALEIMRPLAEQGQVNAETYAELYDRIQVAQNMPQTYGTQYRIVDNDGVLRLKLATAIEDPANLDARRQALGLMPYTQYVQDMSRKYNVAMPLGGQLAR